MIILICLKLALEIKASARSRQKKGASNSVSFNNNIMKTFLQFKNTICFLLLSGAFLFSGCSSSPSPNQAEQQLSQIITSKSKGQIKLIGFQKTNGQKVDNDSYEMTYQAEIEFEADGD